MGYFTNSNNINIEDDIDPYKNMPNVKKLMNTTIDDIELKRKNKISLAVLQSIKEQCEDTIVETADNINTLFGSMVASKSIENKELSNMITNLFTDTNVKVYVYISYDINAYTFPGINILSSPFLQRIQNILSSFPLRIAAYLHSVFSSFYLTSASMFYLFLSILEQSINSINSKLEYKSTDYLSYNPNTKKFTIGQKNITIYISSNLIKYINNDKELTAILLHEIGHNVKVAHSILENLLSFGFYSSVLSSCYLYIKEMYSDNKFETNSYHHKAIISVIISILLLVFGMYMSAYISRKEEVYADEFAIKCGYGKHLLNAINKLNILSNELSSNNILKSDSNTKSKANESYIKCNKILQSLSKLLSYLNTYPPDREELIYNKIKSYDLSKNNIDRTSNIKNY